MRRISQYLNFWGGGTVENSPLAKDWLFLPSWTVYYREQKNALLYWPFQLKLSWIFQCLVNWAERFHGRLRKTSGNERRGWGEGRRQTSRLLFCSADSGLRSRLEAELLCWTGRPRNQRLFRWCNFLYMTYFFTFECVLDGLQKRVFRVCFFLFLPVIVPLVIDRLWLFLDWQVFQDILTQGCLGSILHQRIYPPKGQLVETGSLIPIL